jgi:hypothetical protein
MTHREKFEFLLFMAAGAAYLFWMAVIFAATINWSFMKEKPDLDMVLGFLTFLGIYAGIKRANRWGDPQKNEKRLGELWMLFFLLYDFIVLNTLELFVQGAAKPDVVKWTSWGVVLIFSINETIKRMDQRRCNNHNTHDTNSGGRAQTNPPN